MGSQDEQGTSRPALIKKSPSLSTIKEKSDTAPEDVTDGCNKGKSIIRRSNTPISNSDSDSDNENINLDLSDIAPLEEEEYKVFSRNHRHDDNLSDESDSREESMLCTEELVGSTQSLMQRRNDDDSTDEETPQPVKQNLETISEEKEKSPNAIKNEESSNLQRSTTDISIANEAESISSKIDNFNDISFDLDSNEAGKESQESVKEIVKKELAVSRKSQRERRPSAKIKEIQSNEVMANEKHIDEDEGKAKPKFQTELDTPSTTATEPNKSELKRSLEKPKIEVRSKKPKFNTNLKTDKIETLTKSSGQVNEDNEMPVNHIDEEKIQQEIQSAGPRRSSRAKRPSAKLKDLQEENKRKSTEITQTEVALRNSKDLKQHQALPQNSKKRSKNVEVDIEMVNRESVPKSTIELEPSESKKVEKEVIPNKSRQKNDEVETVEPNKMSGSNLEKTLQIKIDKLVLPVEMVSTSTASMVSNNSGLKRSMENQQTESLSKKPKIEAKLKIEEVETVTKRSGRVNRKSNSSNPKNSQPTVEHSVPKPQLEKETKRSVRASRSRSSNTKNMVEPSQHELQPEDLKPKQGGRRSRAGSSNSNVKNITEKSKSVEETTQITKIELESKPKRGGTRSRASSSNSNSNDKDITEKSTKMKKQENEVNPVVKTTRKSEPVPKKVSRTSSRSRTNSNASPVKKDGRTLSVIVGTVSHKMSIITIFGHKHFKPKFHQFLNLIFFTKIF